MVSTQTRNTPAVIYAAETNRNSLIRQGELSNRYRVIQCCEFYARQLVKLYAGLTYSDAQDLVHSFVDAGVNNANMLATSFNSTDFVVYTKKVSDFNAKNAVPSILRAQREPVPCRSCGQLRQIMTTSTVVFSNTQAFEREQAGLDLLMSLPIADRKQFVDDIRDYYRGRLVRLEPRKEELRRVLSDDVCRQIAAFNPDWTDPTVVHRFRLAVARVRVVKTVERSLVDTDPDKWFRELVTDDFVSIYDQGLGPRVLAVTPPGPEILLAVAVLASMAPHFRSQFLRFIVGRYMKPVRGKRRRGHAGKLHRFEELMTLVGVNTFQYLATHLDLLTSTGLYCHMATVDPRRFPIGPSECIPDHLIGTLLQMYQPSESQTLMGVAFLEETPHVLDFVEYLSGTFSVVHTADVMNDYRPWLYPIYKLFLGDQLVNRLTEVGYFRHLLQSRPLPVKDGTYKPFLPRQEPDGITLADVFRTYCARFYSEEDFDSGVDLNTETGESLVGPVDLFTRARQQTDACVPVTTEEVIPVEGVGDSTVRVQHTDGMNVLVPSIAEQTVPVEGVGDPTIRYHVDRGDLVGTREPKTFINLRQQYELREYAHGVRVGYHFRFDRTWFYDEDVSLDDTIFAFLLNVFQYPRPYIRSDGVIVIYFDNL